MNAVLHVGWASFVTSLREKEPLFWFVLFPLLLLSILTLVFGELGKEGKMNFTVALANLDPIPGGPAAAVEELFLQLTVPTERGKDPLFTLHRALPGDERFVARAQEDVRLGRIAVLVVIPSSFTAEVLAALSGGGPPASLPIYVNGASAASGLAADIVEQLLAQFNQELLARVGRYRTERALVSRTEWVGGKSPVAYVDFLLPGIVLMAFFVGGLFSVPGTILFSRDLKILRRYWVTPLGVPHYLAGFSLGYGAMCVLQFSLLVLVARLGFGATVTFARPLAVLYLLLAAVTFLSFGFLVASLARTAQGGMALANLLNMPMMFLSGLFFPVADLPPVLEAFLYLNPLSYLAWGLRFSVGTGTLPIPLPITFAVPLGWAVVSAGVAARRLRWDVGR